MRRASTEEETEGGKLKQLHSSTFYIGVSSSIPVTYPAASHYTWLKPKEINGNSLQY